MIWTVLLLYCVGCMGFTVWRFQKYLPELMDEYYRQVDGKYYMESPAMVKLVMSITLVFSVVTSPVMLPVNLFKRMTGTKES